MQADCSDNEASGTPCLPPSGSVSSSGHTQAEPAAARTCRLRTHTEGRMSVQCFQLCLMVGTPEQVGGACSEPLVMSCSWIRLDPAWVLGPLRVHLLQASALPSLPHTSALNRKCTVFPKVYFRTLDSAGFLGDV